jgi:hypothetical protein
MKNLMAHRRRVAVVLGLSLAGWLLFERMAHAQIDRLCEV